MVWFGEKVLKPALFAAALLGGAGTTHAQEILIATGAPNPMSVSLGRAICHMVTRAADSGCQPVETRDSIDSLTNIAGGAIDFALVPADMQYHAIAKSGPFAFIDTDFSDLRSVFSLHGEAITAVAHAKVGASYFGDLHGWRVNLGSGASREAEFAEVVLDAMGWTDSDFAFVDRLPRQEQTLALCHRRIDAFVHYGAHPDPTLTQAAMLCDGRVIGFSDTESEKLLAAAPYLMLMSLPSDLYPGSSENIQTLGVPMTLVASAVVDDDTVERLTAAVFEELSRFRKMHPAFADLTPEDMIREGQFAPLHPGAERYFDEKGLM